MPDPVTYSLTTPQDLLGVVPYLLGYHPEDDLIVVFQQTDHLLRRAGEPANPR